MAFRVYSSSKKNCTAAQQSNAVKSSPVSATRRHRAVLLNQQLQQQQQQGILQQLSAAAAAACLAASLNLLPVYVPPAAAAQPQQLADLLREDFGFVDANKDGLVTKSELQQLVKSISSEANLPLVGNEQIDFTMKLFDLNQDGKLTTEELLRSLVLDGAVDENAIDADVFGVFDSNGNGTVEVDEFKTALGDVGRNGEATKDFVFGRVDNLSSSNGSLNSSAFANALVLMRTVLLGY